MENHSNQTPQNTGQQSPGPQVQGHQSTAPQVKHERTAEIIKVGSTAAVASIALAFLEAFEGVLAGSIDMIIDGLSHISEAGGAVITVIGARFGGRKPDRKHPFGYGRIEYISAILIALITIYAGITGVVEGVESILNPTHPHYGVVPLAIVVISMITRIVVGRHDIHVGEHHNSRALLQVGRTELKHSLLSAVTLVSAAIHLMFHVEIGPFVAALISLNILWNGFIMLKDMLSSLLGEKNDSGLIHNIRDSILKEPGVEGVYDLVLNNYGPNTHTASVHIGVPDTLPVNELDKMTRHITRRVQQEQDVLLTAVGIYPVNTTDPEVIAMREAVSTICQEQGFVEQLHGFYVDKELKEIRFDLVVSFDTLDHIEVKDIVEAEVSKLYPDYQVTAVVENDFGM